MLFTKPRSSKRRLSIIALALPAFALGAALFATSAFATGMSESARWRVQAVALGSGESKELACKSEGDLTLSTEIGTTPITIQATGIECIEMAIRQEGSAAKISGKIKLTGASMTTPTGCKVPSTITTELLKGTTYIEGTKMYEKFEPVNSESGWFTFPITVCSLASSPKMTGTLFGRFVHVPGEEVAPQSLQFSRAINAEAGGALRWGTKVLSFGGLLDTYVGALGSTRNFGVSAF